MKLKSGIFCVLFIGFRLSCSGLSIIDSLKSVLNNPDPSQRINAYLRLADVYQSINSDSSMKYGRAALELAKKIGSKEFEGYALNSIGNVFLSKSEYNDALKNYFESEKIFEVLNKAYGRTIVINNIGTIYEIQDLFDKALNQYVIALKISENAGHKDHVASSLNHLGSLYYYNKDTLKALEYFRKSLNVYQVLNDMPNAMNALNNVGIIYQELGNYEEALQSLLPPLRYSQKIGDAKGTAQSYHNIALVYKDMKQDKNALFYLDSALAEVKKIKDYKDMIDIYSSLSEIYKTQNNYVKAFEYYTLSVGSKDSVFGQERDRQFIEMNTKYQTEKKEAENKILKTEGEKQKAITTGIAIGLILAMALAFFIFRGYRQKQKANILLNAQNIEINDKKNIIEQKNRIVEAQHKDITDSIRYSKRIQDATLPPDKLWQETLPESFVYFMPKDILSGDFYWMEETDKFIFTAVADCTGHGVPGALMSIINYNLLNKALLEKGFTDPADILNSVNAGLTVALHQSGKEAAVKDGMDITLISINKKTKEVVFAGAINSIYVISNNEIIEYDGNKFPVGAFIEEKPQSFTSQKLNTKKNDTVYLFTDGFADQFGGLKGKKLKYKLFKDILLEASSHKITEQKEKINKRFTEWKGNFEQIDDVCVIGIKV